MAFDGTEGTVITLATASDWTENYRDVKASGDPNGQFYGKSKITDILDQEDCVGIRIYYAINGDDEKVLVLVGAKANEDDIDDGDIVEMGTKCPPRCGRNNDLNS
ncbi:MAG: hypothetical protein QNK23_15880 [Crocinitomicaceae bacterium]|nr:hypothetical protein [Crocinitomicaceae bacterium]